MDDQNDREASSSTATLPTYQATPDSPIFATPSLQQTYNDAVEMWRARYRHEAIMRHGGNIDRMTSGVLQEIEASAKTSAAREIADDAFSAAVPEAGQDGTDEQRMAEKKTSQFPQCFPKCSVATICGIVIGTFWLVLIILWLVFIYKQDQTCIQKYNELYQQCQDYGWGSCEHRASSERDNCFWGPWNSFWTAIWKVLWWVLAALGVLIVVTVGTAAIAACVGVSLTTVLYRISKLKEKRNSQQDHEMTALNNEV